jgi:hypothetical protein
MSRVEPQLREYFDAGVERITVDDVIAQAEVRQNHLEPLRGRRTLRPAWAAVGAFAVTILGLGGLAVALRLTESITGEFGSSASEVVASDGGTLGVWLIAGFVAALTTGAGVWFVRRPVERETQEHNDEGKVMVMETIEDTGSKTGIAKETKQPSRIPTVLVVVLAVALAGLVAWMVFMMRPNSPNAAPPEIVQLMEDYHAAWNAYDADALEALVTDSYRLHGPDDSFSDDDYRTFDNDMEEIRGSLMPLIQGWDWQVTAPGPVYAVNTSESTWAVSEEGSTITRNGIDYETNALWTVVESNGDFLVSDHYMVGG